MTMLAPAPMPTSGSARRRAKAEGNRQNSYDLEVSEAFRTDGVPKSAVAVSICSCGFTQWLMPARSEEEAQGGREDFDRANQDHDSYCADVNGGAW